MTFSSCPPIIAKILLQRENLTGVIFNSRSMSKCIKSLEPQSVKIKRLNVNRDMKLLKLISLLEKFTPDVIDNVSLNVILSKNHVEFDKFCDVLSKFVNVTFLRVKLVFDDDYVCDYFPSFVSCVNKLKKLGILHIQLNPKCWSTLDCSTLEYRGYFELTCFEESDVNQLRSIFDTRCKSLSLNLNLTTNTISDLFSMLNIKSKKSIEINVTILDRISNDVVLANMSFSLASAKMDILSLELTGEKELNWEMLVDAFESNRYLSKLQITKLSKGLKLSVQDQISDISRARTKRRRSCDMMIFEMRVIWKMGGNYIAKLSRDLLELLCEFVKSTQFDYAWERK